MNALSQFDNLKKYFQNFSALAIYLDYDGTLTPIVQNPKLALLKAGQRKVLEKLVKKYFVAIISGRDRKDVEKCVGISEICYAGSHGFDIEGLGLKYEVGMEYLSDLDSAEEELSRDLNGIAGLFVERKKYAIATHFRQVDILKVKYVHEQVKNVQKRYPSLKMTSGKKIDELQPDINWNKGKALLYLQKFMKFNNENILPVYIGDDVTDEDAFEVLQNHGIGIVVRNVPGSTLAKYQLNNVDEVYQFLNKIINYL